MKTEKELNNVAGAIGKLFEEQNFNTADVFVVMGILQHELYRQISKNLDKKQESGHRVKIE